MMGCILGVILVRVAPSSLGRNFLGPSSRDDGCSTPCLWKQEWLDGEHVIFGELLEGKEIILNMEPHGLIGAHHPVSFFPGEVYERYSSLHLL